MVVGVFLMLAVKNGDMKDAMIAAFSSVIGYWIGSSSGSKAKTDQMITQQDRTDRSTK